MLTDGMRSFRELAQLAEDRLLVARAERALLELPWFARLYPRRRDPAALGGVADFTQLGAAVCAFRAHYGLVPSFFPARLAAQATPLEFAAWLLARDHDLYHVLCQYETSDHDEIALQSLLCAQAPSVFGCFISLLLRTAELHAPRYKHLRDLLDAELDHVAMRRGARTRPLFAIDFEQLADRSAEALRQLLELDAPPDRRPANELRNTCSGKHVGPYFNRPHTTAARSTRHLSR